MARQEETEETKARVTKLIDGFEKYVHNPPFIAVQVQVHCYGSCSS